MLQTPGASSNALYAMVPSPAARSGVKRLFDLSLALGALIFFAPLFVVVAFAIVIDSRGPVLFRQRRTGLHGRAFQILKFRSMRVMDDGPDIVQAQRGDARVTRVGWFLRRSSFDELPQLLNVIRGDMSLIGPRPHALAHDDFYASVLADYPKRFRARPGLTGLAQVRGFRGETRTVADMERRMRADIEYIDQWNMGVDLAIMLRTIFILPFHREVY